MRFVIIGIVIAVAFTLFALVDAAMTDGARARGVSKPVWVVIVVLLPVVGGVLWFMIGKGDKVATRPKAPDDDPRFTGNRMSKAAVDEHLADLEARLRELDDEVFPGEGQAEAKDSAPKAGPAKAVQDPEPQGTDETLEGGADPEVKPKTDGDAGAARK